MLQVILCYPHVYPTNAGTICQGLRRRELSILNSYTVRRTKPRDSLTDSIRIEMKTSSIGLSTLNEKMGTREVFDIKLLQKWVPYVSDPDKWYQHLLDLHEGNVEPNSGGYFKNFMTWVCGLNLEDTPYSYKGQA